MNESIRDALFELTRLTAAAAATEDTRELHETLARLRGQAFETMYLIRLSWRAERPRPSATFTLEDLGL